MMSKIKGEEELVRKVSEKYSNLSRTFNERTRRLWAGSESLSIGYGGIEIVSKATGISRSTVIKGMKEITEKREMDNRIREHGGGRKKAVDSNPGIMEELIRLVESSTRGDPMTSLRWTSKSLRKLSAELKDEGYDASHVLVEKLLHEMKYNLKSNRKKDEGKNEPDRNDQFEHINSKVMDFMREDQPVISIDTKKKELIGNFKNNGKEWKPKGEVDEVNVYDFLSDAEGRATPYSIYDMNANEGYVSIGIDHDTAECAVESIRRWWNLMGRKRYPDAKKLMIAADGGGSNGSRVRLWKIELQKFADESHLDITACHYPPGMSKWNKIEHRMCSHITINWRGKPLRSYKTVIELIGNTTTKNGLKISADINTGLYETGKEISDDELDKINLVRDEFHGNWNYTIGSRTR